MTLLLLPLVPAGLITACALLGSGLSALARAGLRRADRRAWLRTAAALLGAAAAGLYAWGLLYVAGAVLTRRHSGPVGRPGSGNAR